MVSEELVRQVAAKVLRRVETEQPARPSAPDQPRSDESFLVIDRERGSQQGEREVPDPVQFFAPWTGEAFLPAGSPAPYPPQPRQAAAHPSQEPFSVTEASEVRSAINELVEFFESQRCSIEKDKPCDHCGACRTLGF
jgi:hypothetical protein